MFSKASFVSSSFPGLMILTSVFGSNFNTKFFKFSDAEAPAALIKTSESSGIFPSTIRIFKLIEIKYLTYCVDTLPSCLLQLIFLDFHLWMDLLKPFLINDLIVNLFPQ